MEEVDRHIELDEEEIFEEARKNLPEYRLEEARVGNGRPKERFCRHSPHSAVVRKWGQDSEFVFLRIRSLSPFRASLASTLWHARFNPTAQHLSHTPCLRHTTTGNERVFGIKDFAN